MVDVAVRGVHGFVGEVAVIGGSSLWERLWFVEVVVGGGGGSSWGMYRFFGGVGLWRG